MRKFISGLVLGAGASRRLGQPKQLLQFKGTTLLGWVVAQAERATGLDEVICVLGREAEQIREQVDFGSARLVENPVFGEGCASSYRAGIAALNPASEAIMIILGDQPSITPEIIDRLAAESRLTASEISLCTYRGARAHPMVFARNLFSQLRDLHGDKAAWKLVDAQSSMVHEVSFDLPTPVDINTITDFERLTIAKEGAAS
jgi:molybdenum cofactor cytidylyltransferase